VVMMGLGLNFELWLGLGLRIKLTTETALFSVVGSTSSFILKQRHFDKTHSARFKIELY